MHTDEIAHRRGIAKSWAISYKKDAYRKLEEAMILFREAKEDKQADKCKEILAFMRSCWQIMDLFKEKEEWTKEAEEFTNKAINLLEPLMKEYMAKGYSFREISHILHWAVSDVELRVGLIKKGM